MVREGDWGDEFEGTREGFMWVGFLGGWDDEGEFRTGDWLVLLGPLLLTIHKMV